MAIHGYAISGVSYDKNDFVAAADCISDVDETGFTVSMTSSGCIGNSVANTIQVINLEYDDSNCNSPCAGAIGEVTV